MTKAVTVALVDCERECYVQKTNHYSSDLNAGMALFSSSAAVRQVSGGPISQSRRIIILRHPTQDQFLIRRDSDLS